MRRLAARRRVLQEIAADAPDFVEVVLDHRGDLYDRHLSDVIAEPDSGGPSLSP